VVELFPGTDIRGSDLTIVTLSQKTATDLAHTGCDVETEREKVTKFVSITNVLFSMSWRFCPKIIAWCCG
jgi:hypothetical protein